MRFKKCFVPGCKNTSFNTVKTFLRINMKVAPLWCSRAGLTFNPKKEYYCCEDHLKLEDAIENFQYWKIMGGKTILNKNYVPYFEINKENMQRDKFPLINDDSELKKLLLKTNENLPPNPHLLPKSNLQTIQETFIPTKFHIGVQYKPQNLDKSTNYRCRNIQYNKLNIRTSMNADNISITSQTEDCAQDFVPSTHGSTTGSELEETNLPADFCLRTKILIMIKNKPKFYIGVPLSFYWIIDYIATEYATDVLNIILVLYKIRQNDTMNKICDLFQINIQKMYSTLPTTLEVLANFFQNLIYLPHPRITKKNLPLVFKIRYSNVRSILDCFEIEIEKPSDPTHQAQTWSQYKGCNTVKYLVGCTPDGFINFISKGYGGRISDKSIVDKSNLIEHLPVNSVILADRGFKAVESILAVKNIKVLRPPSVYSNTKPTKQEVQETKVIASLRVHIERLIRRLREFRFLKPHSVVKHQHLVHLDKIVIIACGLVNLQSKLIKDK